MEDPTKLLIESLNLLLKKLNLEQNIFGYIAVLLILSSLAIIIVFTFACLARYLKSCKKTNFEDFEEEI